MEEILLLDRRNGDSPIRLTHLWLEFPMPPPPDAKLPFTHGIETELQLVNEEGQILRGQTLIESWNSMFQKAQSLLKDLKNSAPEFVRNKIISFETTEKDRHGKILNYVSLKYKFNGKTIEIDCFGPDPNISQITWILELVTPPCETAHELAWWLGSLMNIALKSVPKNVGIIATGINGAEKEYQSGVTFGDHHHIGISNKNDRIAAYNLIRNYIPHLIALTVNSPFLNEMPTGTLLIKKESSLKILPKDCTRSLRLLNNKGQMGPPDKEHYIPSLGSFDQKNFDRIVMRDPPDDRYVDMFPFTTYGTIELRFFDTQFSVARRIAIAMLIQALTYKAIKTLNGKIPAVSSEILVNSREKAIEFGLVGKFFPDPALPQSFAEIYNYNRRTGEKVTRLFQAVQAMFSYLLPELQDLGFTPYLTPLLTSVFGTSKVDPPLGPADFLLFKYKSGGEKYGKLSKELVDMTNKYGVDPFLDPIVDYFGKPDINLETTEETTDIKKRTSREKKQKLPETATVTGSLNLLSKELMPDETLRFSLSLKSSQVPLSVKLILKLVETNSQREEVIQTAMTSLVFTDGQANISERDLKFTIPFGVFQGEKSCRLQVNISDEHKRDLFATDGGKLKVYGTPIVEIRPGKAFPSQFPLHEDFHIPYEINNRTSQFQGKYKFKFLVLSMLNKAYYVDETDLRLKGRQEHIFKGSLEKNKKIGNPSEVKLRAQLIFRDKILAEHTSPTIPVSVPTQPASNEPQIKARSKRGKEKRKAFANSPPQPKIQVKTNIPSSITAPRTPPSPKNKGKKTRPSPPIPTPAAGTPQPKSRKNPKVRVKTKVSITSSTGTPTPQTKVTVPPRTSSSAVPTSTTRKKTSKSKSTTPLGQTSRGTSTSSRPTASSKRQPPVSKRQPVARTSPRPPTSSIPSSISLGSQRTQTKTTIAGDFPKTEYFITEKVKYEFVVSKPDNIPDIDDCRYKVYYIPANPGATKKYLVQEGTSRIKGTLKVKGKFKAQKPYPTAASFYLACIVLENENVTIGQYTSPPLFFENKVPEKHVKIVRIENLQKVILPGQHLVPIVLVQTQGLVAEEILRFTLKLVDSANTVFTSTSFEKKATSTGIYRFPLPLSCDNIPPDVDRVILRISVRMINYTPPPQVYKKDIKIRVRPGKSDLDVTFVGTKNSVFPVGSDALVWAQITNNSPYTYKGGKITVFFVPNREPMFPVYKRKFQIVGNDNYTLAERLQVPLSLLGDEVFVYIDLPVKSKGAKVSTRIQEMSKTGFTATPPSTKPLTIKLETDRRSLEAHPNESIPIRIDMRKNISLGDLSYNLVANYENIRQKIVAKGKLKRKQDYTVHELRWKIPRDIGNYSLLVEVFENKVSLDGRLIEQKALDFVITPTPAY